MTEPTSSTSTDTTIADYGQQVAMARRLLTWLVKTWAGDLISMPDILQRAPREFRSKATAARMVEMLEESLWLLPAGNNVIGGKPRRKAWRVVKQEIPD